MLGVLEEFTGKLVNVDEHAQHALQADVDGVDVELAAFANCGESNTETLFLLSN
jgi:hypothetical protein